MASLPAPDPVPQMTDFDPPPLVASRTNWSRWLGPAISLAILAAVFRQVSGMELRADLRMVPTSASFWVVFALYYMSTPFWEWLVYRRLWGLPGSGITALLRKNISNELLLGYLGEAYFYGWARQRAGMVTSPFGAIKDVAILSALCGNIVTVAIMPLGVKLVESLWPGIDHRLLYGSVAVFAASSLLPLLFRRRLFSLPQAKLWMIVQLQMARICGAIVLYAAMWHLVLPAVAFGWWLTLAALRQMVSRLPLVPNKEILFAGIAVFFLGRQAEISGLLALFGTFTLAVHVAIGIVLGASGLLERGET